jgi:hypothetical protein
MAYPPRVVEALKLLDAAGISRRQSAPLIYRILWSRGIEIRPPQFHGVMVGVMVPVIIATVTSAAVRVALEGSVSRSLVISWAISMAVFIAIFVPWILKNRRRLNLPDWSEIGVANRFD